MPIAGCVGVGLAGAGNTKTAACATATLSVGSHAISANYSGDRANPPTKSTVGTQVITPRPATTTALASSVNPSMFGQAVIFTATVAGSSPTGTVSFKDGSSNFPGCVARPVSGGTAVCTVNQLGTGQHAVTGVYSGDLNNAPSTSPVLNQVVNCAPGGRCP